MTAGGTRHTKRNDAGQHLKHLLQHELSAFIGSSHQRYQLRPGHLGGFDLTASMHRVLGKIELVLSLDGAPGTDIRLAPKDPAEAEPARLIVRLENRLAGLEALKTKTLTEAERLRGQTAHANADLGKPFPQTTQLAAARARVREINEQLKNAAAPPQTDGYRPLPASSMPEFAPTTGNLAPDAVAIASQSFPATNPPDGHNAHADSTASPSAVQAPHPASRRSR